MGRVGRPHGTGGAFHLSEPTERTELLESGRRVHVGDDPVVVESQAGTPARPALKLEGIDDRASAEALRGADITVPREDVGALAEGEHLIDELIGCQVIADGAAIGQVRDVLLLPSVEALEVERPGADTLLVPLVSDAVSSVDTERGRIEVDLRFLGGGSDGD